VVSSAYAAKNNCSLFERLFKVKKNGVFLFGISPHFRDIHFFLYYANEESEKYLQKYGNNILQIWHQKCTSQTEKETK